MEEILGSLNSPQKETVQNLRELVKAGVPETVEFVKTRGKIVYKLGNKDFVWIKPLPATCRFRVCYGCKP